jgi:hypothetical protein
MNAKQAIDKIAELLKFTFKAEKFYSTKLIDGTEVTNNLDEDFKIGQVLYVVGDSTLTPAPAGSHITRENLKVTVDIESVIIAIESGDTIAENAMEMTEARDAQGQLLESTTFDVGEMVYQIMENGSKEPAPNGEHQVVLKDESGNENKIRIQVKDGIITERSNVEEMAAVGNPQSGIIEEPESGIESEDGGGLDKLLQLLGPMIEEMTKMKSEMESMKGKMSADLLALKNDFNSFKKSPEKFSVVERKTMTESFEDYKLELIKSLRK